MPKTALKLLIALGIAASTACGSAEDSNTATDGTSTETGTSNPGTTTPETTTASENLSEEEKALRALDAKVEGFYTLQVTLATDTTFFGTTSSTDTTFYGVANIAIAAGAALAILGLGVVALGVPLVLAFGE